MPEHLTVEQLLLAMKYCKGLVGGDTCVGCPNAVQGTQDESGFCQCRFDLHDETIRVLEDLTRERR